MIIPEKMKLNKFKLVVMPRNADYFARFGSSFSSESVYGGDDNQSRQESKLDQLNRTMEEFDKLNLEDEAAKLRG